MTKEINPETIPTLGELLPEDQNPEQLPETEQPPEQPPEALSTEGLSEVLLEVKKVEVQSLSEAITALVNVLVEGKSLVSEVKLVLVEVGNLKMELTQALEEMEAPPETPPEVSPETPPEVSTETPPEQPKKKKIKLF